MALISCPECGNLLSDSAQTCPHCGYRTSVCRAPAGPTPTKIGEISQNRTAGIILLFLGVFFFGVFIFAIIEFFLIGVFIMWVPCLLLSSGAQKFYGTCKIRCPHCGRVLNFRKNFETYKCPFCKKRSVRQDDYLNPVL